MYCIHLCVCFVCACVCFVHTVATSTIRISPTSIADISKQFAINYRWSERHTLAIVSVSPFALSPACKRASVAIELPDLLLTMLVFVLRAVCIDSVPVGLWVGRRFAVVVCACVCDCDSVCNHIWCPRSSWVWVCVCVSAISSPLSFISIRWNDYYRMAVAIANSPSTRRLQLNFHMVFRCCNLSHPTINHN